MLLILVNGDPYGDLYRPYILVQSLRGTVCLLVSPGL